MAKAISIAPSENWSGDDGSWSTFALQLGSNAQVVYVLPATSSSSIWAIASSFCVGWKDVSECTALRGGVFDYADSTTYQQLAEDLALPFFPEANLGTNYSGPGHVGVDTAALGLPGSGAPLLVKQTIVSVVNVTSPWLGLLGLTPRPPNVTTASESDESPLGTLRSTNKVPSSYWAYNAGAGYRGSQGVLASLTFGGYDETRGDVSNGLTVPFNPQNNRDLTVAITGIQINDDVVDGLPIYAYIDSVVPEIWLPKSACHSFEKAFGITWNSVYQLYVITGAQRKALIAQDASVTFSLAKTETDGMSNSLNITLPYASFDLQISWPLAGEFLNDDLYYFPLKQANNSEQYFLGRTFLQEAYLTADYDRSQFTISQALFPESADSKLVTVHPPNHSHGLSGGAIAGIAVGVVAAIVLIAIGIWFAVKKSRKRRSQQQAQVPELGGVQEYYDKQSGNGESSDGFDNRFGKVEMDTDPPVQSMAAKRAELESPQSAAQIQHRRFGSDGSSSAGSPQTAYQRFGTNGYHSPGSLQIVEMESPPQQFPSIPELDAGPLRQELGTDEPAAHEAESPPTLPAESPPAQDAETPPALEAETAPARETDPLVGHNSDTPAIRVTQSPSDTHPSATPESAKKDR